MPKMKSHGGTKKRFRVSPNGNVKHKQMGKNHNAMSKNRKRMRKLNKNRWMAGNKQSKTVKALIQD